LKRGFTYNTIKKSELDRIVRVEENLHELYELRHKHRITESEQEEISRRLESFPGIGRGNEFKRGLEYIGRELEELKNECEKIKRKRVQINERILALRDSILDPLTKFELGIDVEWDSQVGVG